MCIQVYRVPANGETKEDLAGRELYNRSNAFWTSRGVSELLERIGDEEKKEELVKRIEGIKIKYDKLSETYQASKGRAGIPLD